MEGEWSCYGGGEFKGGRMVMLLRWPIKGGRMVMLQRWFNGWMNGVLGHFYALSRLNWAGDNGGLMEG